MHYGVREFGMCALMNGIALHGGFLPFGGTFLIFMEYARNAVRMAALMKQRVIYVFTHDSIGLGEDGPTHQPIEQLEACARLQVWRPGVHAIPRKLLSLGKKLWDIRVRPHLRYRARGSQTSHVMGNRSLTSLAVAMY